MAIPRLPAATNPITVDITVNKKLRPYFQQWYQAERETGETPEQFALRVLKTQALNFHIQQNIEAERVAIEQAKQEAEQAVNTDIRAMGTEVA